MNVTLPSLRPHQVDQKDRVRAALAKHGRVILSAPPGVGKTRMAKWILGASINRTPGDKASGRSLFAVFKRSLVDNAIGSFEEEPGLPHGVIMHGEDTSYGSTVQVASIDSLLSWFVEDDKYQSDLTFDLIVLDETDSHWPKFARFLKYQDARREEMGLHRSYVIGLTATPQAKGLADVYKEIIQGPATQWLIDNKYLSPFRYFRATEGKLGLLVKRGNEFTQDSVKAAFDDMAGDLVRDWKLYAEGRPTIGFFPRRSHAKEAQAQLAEAGLRAEYVDANTPDEKRRMIFKWLSDHEIDYLCNVMIVDRGTDIPCVSCVQVCTAVCSEKRWRQMIGRPSRIHPSKTDAVIIDHGGNLLPRGLSLFEDDIHWSLDITTKDPGEAGIRPVIECPKCKALYRGGRCVHCGYEPTPKERKGQGLEFDGRELTEIKREEKEKRYAKAPQAMMVAALYMAGRTGKTWKQCVGIYLRLCEKTGTKHRVPHTVTVAGRTYSMLRFGSMDGTRRVSSLFPFTIGKPHGGKYLVADQKTVGSPY